jgi:hypothetical protein
VNLETYLDLINGLNNQVDNVKRSLLQEFHDKSVWIDLDESKRFLSFLIPLDNDRYHIVLEKYSAAGHKRELIFFFSDIKQLLIHDHRLVIVL